MKEMEGIKETTNWQSLHVRLVELTLIDNDAYATLPFVCQHNTLHIVGK